MSKRILFNVNAFDDGYYESEKFNRSNRASVKSQQLFCEHYADEYEYRLFTYEDDIVIEAKKKYAYYVNLCEQNGWYNYATDAVRLYILLHLDNAVYLDDDVYIYNFEKTHAFLSSLKGQYVINSRFYCVVNTGAGDDIRRMSEYMLHLKERRSDKYIVEKTNPRLARYSISAGFFHFPLNEDTSFELIDTLNSDYVFDPGGYTKRFEGCSNDDEEKLPAILQELFPVCFKQSYDKHKSYYFLVLGDTFGTYMSKKKLPTAKTRVIVIYINVNEFENLDTFILEMTK